MEPRIHYVKYSQSSLKAMYALTEEVKKSALGTSLLNLIFLRASQINGCAYCIDLHFKDARAFGETEQRLYSLDAWRETPFYNPRERAALSWTESLTLISQNHVPDDVYNEVHEQFSENEIVDLTYAVMAINSWNRLAISMRAVPGHYQPKPAAAAAS
jgi:AhpD family alkylhydroperoxidase